MEVMMVTMSSQLVARDPAWQGHGDNLSGFYHASDIAIHSGHAHPRHLGLGCIQYFLWCKRPSRLFQYCLYRVALTCRSFHPDFLIAGQHKTSSMH